MFLAGFESIHSQAFHGTPMKKTTVNEEIFVGNLIS